MRTVAAFVLTAVYISAVHGKPVENANSFICIADKAAGFSYNETRSEWEGLSFDAVEEGKHLFKKEDDGAWSVSVIGHENIVFECDKEFDDHGFLTCGDKSWNFLMNRKTLRYQEYVAGTYVVSEHVDHRLLRLSPYIKIGKCLVLEYAKGPWDKYD